MTMLVAALLGIVEGITEFLPISSTGHLILTQKLLGMQSTDMLESFDIAIQLGAILAVALVYRETILKRRSLWPTVLAAFIPTAIIGAVLHQLVKTYLLGSSTVVVWALLIGGLVILLFEATYRKEQASVPSLEKISLKKAFGVGVFQSLALIPGVSRSAATILGGMLLGIERKMIVDFSFLLAIPTMAAATGLDMLKSYQSFSAHDAQTLGIGFAFAFVTALLAITWLLRFVKAHTFTAFGVYRIVIAIVFWVWVV